MDDRMNDRMNDTTSTTILSPSPFLKKMIITPPPLSLGISI